MIHYKRYLTIAFTSGAFALASSALADEQTKGHACCSQGGDHHMSMMDANHDGKLTSAEHAAGAKKMFQMMDKDANGTVTVAEMEAVQMGMRGDHGEAKSDGEHRATSEAQQKKMKSSAEKIAAIDANGDGALTAREHEAGAATMFKKMDTDGDGSLTEAEMKAGHQSLMSSDEHKH